MALLGSMWPAPCDHGSKPFCMPVRPSSSVLKAVVISADLMAAGDQVGCACLSSSATPVTCGVAIDVPSYDAQSGGARSVPAATASRCAWVKAAALRWR